MNISIISILFDIVTILEKYDPKNQLNLYFDNLKNENLKINLVSRETIETSLPLLAAESLLPFDKISRSEFGAYLDIGSGGGFPSIPVIITQNISRGFLVERTGKKASALKRISDQLPLGSKRVQILTVNFEEHKFSGQFDLITLRLVKLTKSLFKKIYSLLTKNGIFIYYSIPEIDLAEYDCSVVSYCYKASPSSVNKHFSIIQKNN